MSRTLADPFKTHHGGEDREPTKKNKTKNPKKGRLYLCHLTTTHTNIPSLSLPTLSPPPHTPLACVVTILSFLTSPVPHTLIARGAAASQATAGRSRQRDIVRLALPSKGRMAEDTLALLKECELTVRKPNPRQYIAEISELGKTSECMLTSWDGRVLACCIYANRGPGGVASARVGLREEAAER
ncbi:unnamed protein product [Closterium sp. NIES-53]